MAAWAGLDAQPAIEKLQEGKSPTDAELATGVSGLKRAATWIPSARRMTDLALLELEQAIRMPVADAARGPLLTSAEQHLTAGLAANPVNGFAWLRLAFVRDLRQGKPRQIAAALVQSIDMAPNMRKLWLPRSTMLFAYWQDLTFEELLVARAQLQTIWAADQTLRWPLLQAAAQAGQLAFLTWALTDSPPLLEEVEKLKAASPRPVAR